MRKLEKGGVIAKAARSAGLTPSIVDKMRLADAVLDEQARDAVAIYNGNLEAELLKRAKKSDGLLTFAIRGRMKGEYAERHEHTGAGGGPLRVAGDAQRGAAMLAELGLPRAASAGGGPRG